VEVQTPMKEDEDVIFPGENVSLLFKGIEVVIPSNALFQEGYAYLLYIQFNALSAYILSIY